MKKKIVFFQGTFDILTTGHCRAFKLCKQHGNYLIVGLNSDSLIQWFKKKEPLFPFKERKEILESIRWIDEVILCEEPNPINYIKKYNVDVYVLTEEWKESNKEPIEYVQKKGGKVVFMKQDEVQHTSDIRRKLFDEFNKK